MKLNVWVECIFMPDAYLDKFCNFVMGFSLRDASAAHRRIQKQTRNIRWKSHSRVLQSKMKKCFVHGITPEYMYEFPLIRWKNYLDIVDHCRCSTGCSSLLGKDLPGRCDWLRAYFHNTSTLARGEERVDAQNSKPIASAIVNLMHAFFLHAYISSGHQWTHTYERETIDCLPMRRIQGGFWI